MLSHVHLRNFVIVDEAALDFGAGLTALTGETGAGKSIVVDALLLIAGGRATADVVRQGAERAEVTASFNDLSAPARAWLEEQSIDHDDEVIVRRLVGIDGRSRAYLNGQLVPIQTLREFGEHLVEIHGQQEFQRLVNRAAQRRLLDEHLDEPAAPERVRDVFERYRACRRAHDDLTAAAQNRDARLDLLRYQLTELEADVTTTEDIDALFVEQKRVAGRGRLGEAARQALEVLSEADEGSAHDLLARVQSTLRGIGEADPVLQQATSLVTEATIAAQEAAAVLRRYLDVLDIDPARQEQIETKAATLESLARKHRVSVVGLPAQRAALEAEVAALDHADQNLAELGGALEVLTREYETAALRLSATRRRAAQSLAEQISALMQTLGMAGGRFAVSVEPSGGEFGPNGVDDIEFLVSANPGQALKGLAKVASGGELSRTSLAVQVAAAARHSSLAMVFDEVDAGIGGGTAEIVGRQLRELGERCQVLCVTHLAQVAALAHRQFRVSKVTDGKITHTVVTPLSDRERVDEVARMLGGIDITMQARAHAEQMLRAAERIAAPEPPVNDTPSTKKKRKQASTR